MKTALTLICLFAIGTASGAETFNSVGHFYTNLPPSWVVVPDGALKKWVQEREAKTSIKIKETGIFAYQAQPSGAAWLTGPPYCIASVFRESGSDSAWLRLASKSDADLDAKIAAIVSHQISPAAMGAQKEGVYDSVRHILWSPLNLPNNSESDDTRMVCLLARVLTRDGYIKFWFYSMVPQYAESISQFRQVVESIRFTEGMEYGASNLGGGSAGRSWQGKNWITIIAISAMFAIAAGLKSVFRSRGKTKE